MKKNSNDFDFEVAYPNIEDPNRDSKYDTINVFLIIIATIVSITCLSRILIFLFRFCI